MMWRILRLSGLVPFLIYLGGCAAPTNSIDPSAQNATRSDTLQEAISSSSTATLPTGEVAPAASLHLAAEDTGSRTAIQRAVDFCALSQTSRKNGDADQALKLLDQAYSLLLKIDQNDPPDLVKQKEALRYQISKRILEIYACRNTQAKGQHHAIPLDMNTHVEKEIAFLSKGSFLKDAYQRSGRYRAFIVSELEAAGLPTELSWLPLIESGFKVKALSSARALGLWQFIPSTGYKFGLKRNQFIDERLDYVKSTRAAIAYMKELHKIFGDWSTVLAAYNCGEGRVLKVIRNQHVNYLDNFWDLYERLPYETARYFPRFIATLHIIENPEKYGFTDLSLDPPLEFDTITTHRQLSLASIATALQVSEKELQSLNPELRHRICPNEAYSLRIPKDIPENLIAAVDDLGPTQLPSQIRFVYHKIRRGETLSGIAGKYRTSVTRIVRANKLSARNRIRAGSVLKIPVKGSSTAAGTPAVAAPRQQKKATHHRVVKGDSLWNIAKKYGISTRDLKRCNDLKSSYLAIGQVIRLPVDGRCSSNESAQADHHYKTYQVKNGDVPIEIAKQHNMTLDQFLKVNSFTRESKLFPGQKVYVE